MLCQEAAPKPSWHGYSAPVLRVPGKRHPAMAFLHESIPHGQSIPSHICVHTCNKEINQLKASKHELEREKHMLGLSTSRETSILECHLVAVVPKLYSCALGQRGNTCLVAKGCSRACLDISAQRRKEMLLADKYFRRGHRFQLAPGIKSSQDIFLIKPRGFLSSFLLFLWQYKISSGNSAGVLENMTDWLIRA